MLQQYQMPPIKGTRNLIAIAAMKDYRPTSRSQRTWQQERSLVLRYGTDATAMWQDGADEE